jgi:hypothetical protein
MATSSEAPVNISDTYSYASRKSLRIAVTFFEQRFFPFEVHRQIPKTPWQPALLAYARIIGTIMIGVDAVAIFSDHATRRKMTRVGRDELRHTI